MKNYYWSAKGVCFYPIEDKDKYTAAGFDLSDVILVDDSVFEKYALNHPAGIIRGVGEDGMPTWVDLPKPTAEQNKFSADHVKVELLSQATLAIAPLQDAVDLDEATDVEVAALKAWKQYRVAVNRIDTTTVDILWPKLPV